MLKELRERPEMMGLGLTSSGEPTGMAALEGLVAAIEVRASLQATLRSLQRYSSSTCTGTYYPCAIHLLRTL